ncbi:MAG: DUF1223 domain-containing protein [Methylocystaceae bacterium]|nr:DUF1223 domain-containing protein [Methylocystaceae bacterium]
MKKIILISFFGLILATQSAVANDRLAVVELFTSQGCSSCPPADAFLGELSMRSDVLALAYHVDYWDYIGWKDAYAQSAFTQRQREYAYTFQLRYIYTPQMVVSGNFETSGTKRRSIIAAIEKQLSDTSDIELERTGSELLLHGPSSSVPLQVYQVSYFKEKTTVVRRGENRGKTLSEYNIVHSLEKIMDWSGGEKRLNIQFSQTDPNLGHAVFVQRENDLKILAAIKLN